METKETNVKTSAGNADNTPAAQGRSEKHSDTNWDIRPYLAVGLTVVLVFTICIMIFFFMFRFSGLAAGISKIFNSLQAVIFGLIIAYLVNPIMKFFEWVFKKFLFGGEEKDKTVGQLKLIRGVSVACGVIVFLAIIAMFLLLVVPQIVNSVQDLIGSMNEKSAALMDWVEKIDQQTNGHSDLLDMIRGYVKDGAKMLQKWLQDQILGNTNLIESVTAGVYSVVKVIANFIIGIIICVYVLMTKEKFKGQLKKMIYAIFRPKWGNVTLEVLRKADDVFGGFFIGKIIDSLIIGVIAFICLSITNMPYAMLVSVIVGVTNIIPFFGPYIGAIPSALLIFLVDPLHALYFIIFILILQQVDGNIIGPKILGDSTGLSPFWVIFAILLFGGSFGVVGMIFGVPLFAVIYYLVKRIVEHILGLHNLPESTAKYVNLDKVDVETNEIIEEDQSVLLWGFGKKKKKQMTLEKLKQNIEETLKRDNEDKQD